VHEYDAYPDLIQDAYLFHQGTRAHEVCEDLAANLQDEHLAFEEPDIWSRVFQRGYNGSAIVSGLHDRAPSI
jgi:hypothetical protein